MLVGDGDDDDADDDDDTWMWFTSLNISSMGTLYFSFYMQSLFYELHWRVFYQMENNLILFKIFYIIANTVENSPKNGSSKQ